MDSLDIEWHEKTWWRENMMATLSGFNLFLKHSQVNIFFNTFWKTFLESSNTIENILISLGVKHAVDNMAKC